MDITWSEAFMVLGFAFAGYSIVANDAIQTLGTFLSSNSKKPWWILWIFSCSILAVVIFYGWIAYDGDVSYGRLSSKFPVPDSFHWTHVLPPILIILATRFGIPVSTTFLVLTVFAPTVLSKMLVKSLAGYGVAFTSAIILYFLISNIVEKYFASTRGQKLHSGWVVLQWCSTGYLWSQWLIQDLANIYVYMPSRQLNLFTVLLTLAFLFLCHAIIFARKGGEIQRIVNSKTGTTDIRSATIIDFIYATVLLVFKEMSNIPMSTTWVFLGVLAGREIAITYRLNVRAPVNTWKIVGTDVFKAFIGLAVSVILAYSIPHLRNLF